MTFKRLFLIVLLLLVLAVLAWPAWVGSQAERQMQAWQGGALGEVLVEHQLDDFQRGWFASEATSVIRLRLEGEEVQFPVRHRVSHGYGRVVLDSEPVYPPAVATQLEALFGDRSPITLRTLLRPVANAAELQVNSPAIDGQLPGEPGTRLRSAGLSGVFQWSQDRLQGSLQMADVEIQDADTQLSIRGQILTLDLDDPGSRVADGWAEYQLDSLALAGLEGQEPLHLEALRVRTSQARRGEHMHMDLDLGYGALQAGDQVSSGGELRLELGPIQAQAYDRLIQRLEAVAGLDDERAAELAGAALVEALPELLAHSPELTLSPLRVQMPRGELELMIGARFDGEGFNPDTVDYLPRLGLDGHLKAGSALLEELAGEITIQSMAGSQGMSMDPEARQMLARSLGRGVIQGLVEEGYLVADGEVYRAELSLRDSRLKLNGVDRSEWLYLLLAGLFVPGGFN
ncbi:MAG: DUF945 family protein [Thioalkalivibrio sp.]